MRFFQVSSDNETYVRLVVVDRKSPTLFTVESIYEFCVYRTKKGTLESCIEGLWGLVNIKDDAGNDIYRLPICDNREGENFVPYRGRLTFIRAVKDMVMPKVRVSDVENDDDRYHK